jgi:TRAP-type mannitol/chloroaromatic compound transport system substrate-binding protein
MQRRSFVQSTLAASLLPAPLIVTAQTAITMRMQGFLAAASTPQKLFEVFANDVKQGTGGRVSISVLPAGGAVAATETLNAISNSILDGHYSAPSFFASRDPGFTVLGDTGPAYDNVEQRDRWFREGGGIAASRALYDKYGLHYVDQIFWPSEHIPARKAVNTLADMRGLKIRVPPGMISEMLSRAGAAIVNLPGGEVFNALSSGVIDATDWASPGQNQEVGLYKAAKFSINASHSMPTTEISFAKKRWESLPADVKTVIEQSVKKLDASMKVQMRELDDKALTQMRSDGVQIITWGKDEIAKMRSIVARVQMELGGRNAQARALVDSHRAFMQKQGLATS